MRIAAGLVALGATFPATASATAPSLGPPPTCSTAHALVAYYTGDGWTYNNDLVVRPDGNASLCWGRHISSRAGRKSFIVPRRTMTALAAELRRVGADHLCPPVTQERTNVDAPGSVTSLVYKGKTMPGDGLPDTQTGKRAFRRAVAILDGIIRRFGP